MFEYKLAPLTEEQKEERRLLLDRHAHVAQISVLVVVLAVSLVRFMRSIFITSIKPHSQNGTGLLTETASQALLRWQKVQWQAGNPVGGGRWGTVGDWIHGSLWSIWILVLCVWQTDCDMLHVTKRFGIIAASLLPFHYLLAAKSDIAPIQIMTGLSHEQLNSFHRVLGRIVHLSISFHGGMYITWFWLNDILNKRVKEWDVVIGIISATSFDTIAATSLTILRKKNYRVFHVVHVIVASLLLPVLYFHTHHIRPYILEAVLVYAVHWILRFRAIQTLCCSLTTYGDLITIRVDLRQAQVSATSWKPGQHIYLRVPAAPGDRWLEVNRMLSANPFTIASLPQEDQHLLLVARVLNGSTKLLLALDPDASGVDVQLKVEGPYGAPPKPSHLAGRYDAILLLAGGVGATFTLPIYRAIISDLAMRSRVLPRRPVVRFVWAVKDLGDAEWATPYLIKLTSQPESDEASNQTVTQMHKPEIYVTRSPAVTGGRSKKTRPSSHDGTGDDEEVEMEERDRLLDGASDEDHEGTVIQLRSLKQVTVENRRPSITAIVQDIFGSTCPGARIAVLVCGPPDTMIREARSAVGAWVARGDRHIHWHAENFGS